MEKIKLMQGDCLELMKGIADKSVDMILCDLPYGTTACKWDTIIPFEPLWEQYERVIKDNGAIVLFGSEPFSSHLRLSNLKMYKYDWIWNKQQTGNPFLAKVQPLKVHETISVFSKAKCTYIPQMRQGKMRKKGGYQKDSELYGKQDEYSTTNDQYYPVSILDYSNCNKKGRQHPTQKPVPLFEYLIRTYTNEGETVLDNCMGSGTTGVACLNTNRRFIGIELDETYFNIAKERIYATERVTESD